MFRDYEGNILWAEVSFAAYIVSVILFVILFLYWAITDSNEWMAHRKAFKESCIDAGGYAVEPFDYVKGHGDGFLCINPSAIIQLKDGVK